MTNNKGNSKPTLLESVQAARREQEEKSKRPKESKKMSADASAGKRRCVALENGASKMDRPLSEGEIAGAGVRAMHSENVTYMCIGKDREEAMDKKMERALSNDREEDKLTRRRRGVDAAQFYQRPEELRLSTIEMHVNAYLKRLKEKAIGKQPSKCWRQFHTQQDAFEFVDGEDPDGADLHVFSVELESSGKRKFLVSSFIEFWRRYKDIPEPFRHYYEIIRQNRPCNLYLDLEFNREDNRSLDGEKAVEVTLRVLSDVFKSKLDVEFSKKWVVELDSSSDKKFSRHVIVRMPGSAFLDNSQVGIFVGEMVKLANIRRKASSYYDLMFVQKSGQESCFIDMGVYSRNRAFRLYLSSKAGKHVPLVAAPRIKEEWDDFPEEKIFMHSLVGHVPQGSRLISCSDENVASDGEPAFVFKEARKQTMSNQRTEHGTSLYPALDNFVLQVCRRNVTPRKSAESVGIRSWVQLDQGSVVLYNISGCRFCGNIGREHKSNGIFILVDLRHQVWYQKCYDPECRGYRSPGAPVPVECIQGEQNRFECEITR